MNQTSLSAGKRPHLRDSEQPVYPTRNFLAELSAIIVHEFTTGNGSVKLSAGSAANIGHAVVGFARFIGEQEKIPFDPQAERAALLNAVQKRPIPKSPATMTGLVLTDGKRFVEDFIAAESTHQTRSGGRASPDVIKRHLESLTSRLRKGVELLSAKEILKGLSPQDIINPLAQFHRWDQLPYYAAWNERIAQSLASGDWTKAYEVNIRSRAHAFLKRYLGENPDVEAEKAAWEKIQRGDFKSLPRITVGKKSNQPTFAEHIVKSFPQLVAALTPPGKAATDPGVVLTRTAMHGLLRAAVEALPEKISTKLLSEVSIWDPRSTVMVEIGNFWLEDRTSDADTARTLRSKLRRYMFFVESELSITIDLDAEHQALKAILTAASGSRLPPCAKPKTVTEAILLQGAKWGPRYVEAVRGDTSVEGGDAASRLEVVRSLYRWALERGATTIQYGEIASIALNPADPSHATEAPPSKRASSKAAGALLQRLKVTESAESTTRTETRKLPPQVKVRKQGNEGLLSVIRDVPEQTTDSVKPKRRPGGATRPPTTRNRKSISRARSKH